MTTPYTARREPQSLFLTLRGLRQHVLHWPGDAAVRPPLVMLHGWMDLAASFQFVVDAFGAERRVYALDWRGFGQSNSVPADSYWFPDYLGDLDGLLDEISPAAPVDLLGHSMGGNVAMLYAGVRPARIRRLVNLEGFGMPATRPAQAPVRYRRWLDELREPAVLRPYDDLAAVAARLRKTNPLLAADKAEWLAPRWARQRVDGLWELRADPAHKRVNANLYQREEAVACWAAIEAPVLWVEGDRTDVMRFWGDGYPREDFEQRLAAVRSVRRELLSPAGHMLHHDQPQALAQLIEDFVDCGSADQSPMQLA